MGMIQIDFFSIVIGYIVGVLLTWSLCFTIYGMENEQKTESDCGHLYSGIRNGSGGRFDITYHGTKPIDG